jgi:glycosyltransferase involved in cell wall biosynthesis
MHSTEFPDADRGIDGISIVVCCHNSATRIEATLKALSICEANFPVEILLVDNASTDNTTVVALSAWEHFGRNGFRLRITSEEQLGLAFARRKGVIEALHEVVVFCDDDNWLSPDYLKIVLEIFLNPEVGAAGGQSEPAFDGAAPPFIYSHGHWLALGIQSLFSGDVTHNRGYLWGAGLAVRRSSLLKLYYCPEFPIFTDREGVSSTTFGNDREICWALTVLGKALRYDDRLKLLHFMPRERLHLNYLRQLNSGFGWDARTDRLAAGLTAINEKGRTKTILVSGFRWLRNLGRPKERHYHATLMLASFGLLSMLKGIDRQLYMTLRWLQRQRREGLAHRAAP